MYNISYNTPSYTEKTTPVHGTHALMCLFRINYRQHTASINIVLFVTIFVVWLGSRVVGVLDSGAEAPGFKSQPRRCRVAVLGKLFTPIVPLFTKQRNW